MKEKLPIKKCHEGFPMADSWRCGCIKAYIPFDGEKYALKKAKEEYGKVEVTLIADLYSPDILISEFAIPIHLSSGEDLDDYFDEFYIVRDFGDLKELGLCSKVKDFIVKDEVKNLDRKELERCRKWRLFGKFLESMSEEELLELEVDLDSYASRWWETIDTLFGYDATSVMDHIKERGYMIGEEGMETLMFLNDKKNKKIIPVDLDGISTLRWKDQRDVFMGCVLNKGRFSRLHEIWKILASPRYSIDLT